MKTLLLLVLMILAVCAGALFVPGSAAASTDDAQRVVVKLDHFTGDLHASFMAIKLAGGLAERQADVTLFVNLEGVRAVDARQPQDLAWGHSSSTFADHYNAFVDAGGRILVCPHCAKAAGLDESDLRQGAVIATEEQVMGMLLGADKILDY